VTDPVTLRWLLASGGLTPTLHKQVQLILVSINYDTAVNMLLRAIPLSQQFPYTWGFIDKPPGLPVSEMLSFTEQLTRSH